MQVTFGILMVFVGASSGFLFQDPVVCRFNENKQCYVALGRRLHLQLPQAYKFTLIMTNKTSNILIVKFTKPNSLNTINPRWQFVHENYTVILNNAESNDSETYTLETYDSGGNRNGTYTLQIHTEAEASSVRMWYSCSLSEDIKVYCSADGDNLTYSWTSEFHTISQLENGISTQTLSKEYHGNVTCYVKNHVSQSQNSTVVQPCPEPTTATTTTTTPTTIKSTTRTISAYLMAFLGVFCVLIIIIFIAVLYMYMKKTGQKSQAPTQGNKELVYAEVKHKRNQPRAMISHVQDDNVEYASVAIQGAKRNTKKKVAQEDEVQYGELVFNARAKSDHKAAVAQDDCVYSQVHHGR